MQGYGLGPQQYAPQYPPGAGGAQGMADPAALAAAGGAPGMGADPAQLQQLVQLLGAKMLPKQTAVVECPKSMVGRVIGKGGETIKSLQQYTGAMIQVRTAVPPCHCAWKVLGGWRRQQQAARGIGLCVAAAPPTSYYASNLPLTRLCHPLSPTHRQAD